MSEEEKSLSHARIIESASRLFRERGLDGASVADVMQEAGMTHGGFYKHFDSKDALVRDALRDAFAEFVAVFTQGPARQALATNRALYLSREHVAHPGRGCPVAALGTEVARGTAAIRGEFGAGVRRVIDAIGGRNRLEARRQTVMLREFSMLVGAVVIARASDPELAAEVLAACGGDASTVGAKNRPRIPAHSVPTRPRSR